MAIRHYARGQSIYNLGDCDITFLLVLEGEASLLYPKDKHVLAEQMKAVESLGGLSPLFNSKNTIISSQEIQSAQLVHARSLSRQTSLEEMAG